MIYLSKSNYLEFANEICRRTWGHVMNAFALITAMVFILSSSAFAFDNIEADAVYDSTIKQEIMTEFSQGLKMLKAQADGLGMAVREKDIKKWQLHMFSKALLMGHCVDQAITTKKTSSNKILLDKYVRRCIGDHLKFISWLDTVKWTTPMTFCSMSAKSADRNAPYDFLNMGKDVPNMTDIAHDSYAWQFDAIDYFIMKACYDNRSDTDKMIERLSR
jgi:hypothetical protein